MSTAPWKHPCKGTPWLNEVSLLSPSPSYNHHHHNHYNYILLLLISKMAIAIYPETYVSFNKAMSTHRTQDLWSWPPHNTCKALDKRFEFETLPANRPTPLLSCRAARISSIRDLFWFHFSWYWTHLVRYNAWFDCNLLNELNLSQIT